MLKAKLTALGYPNPSDGLNIDRSEFAKTVVWLEDQKIRLYTIEDRENLRNVGSMEVWDETFKQYCTDIKMPLFETQLEQLTWLTGHAVRLEYLDDPEQYESISRLVADESNMKRTQVQGNVQTIFDGNINVNDKDFITGVRTLAAKLQVPHHPNHLIQLEAIARIVRERVAGPDAKHRKPILGTPFPFDKGNDVVSSNDPHLDYPMRILRLLQIQSLRQLQTKINETIVSIQTLTANPKTDTKLGKVGR